MPKYRVRCAAYLSTRMWAEVEVEAESKEEAKEKVHKLDQVDEINWKEEESERDDELFINNVEEIE